MTPGRLGYIGQIHSDQLGARRWIHGFRYPWLMLSRVTLGPPPPRGGGRCSHDAPLGIMSSLIARLLRAAQEDNPAEVKVLPDAGARQPSVVPEVGMPGQSQLSEAEQVMVCFSCGRPRHGVNRCSWVDTAFPFLPQGWSVDIRDGQYRVVWTGGARVRSPKNERWSGREGQPPRSSGTRERLTPVEGSVLPRSAGANRHGSCWWGMSMAPVGLQARKLFHHWGAIPQGYMDGITEGCRSWLSRCWDGGIRLCRIPAIGMGGAHRRWSPQCPELGDLGGGCGLPDGIVGLRGN